MVPTLKGLKIMSLIEAKKPFQVGRFLFWCSRLGAPATTLGLNSKMVPTLKGLKIMSLIEAKKPFQG